MKKTARSLVLSLSSLSVVAAAPALASPTDGSCVDSSAPAGFAAVATAVNGAAALTSAPSPARFATTWTSYFAAAVRGAAGTDGRLSDKEAARLAESGSLFGDNAVNWLNAKDQKSVDVDKLIQGGWNYAFATGKKVAGEDGRISLDDAKNLPADLSADFLFLRGKSESAPAGATADAVMAALADATPGMYYMSESDARVVPVEAASSGTGAISAAEVKAAFGAQHDTLMTGSLVWGSADPDYPKIADRFIEVQDAATWFERRTSSDMPDYNQQWSNVEAAMKGLTNVTVVRSNQTDDPNVAITSSIFVVGRSADGKLVGIVTGSVET